MNTDPDEPPAREFPSDAARDERRHGRIRRRGLAPAPVFLPFSSRRA
jgi:hypothetical protein